MTRPGVTETHPPVIVIDALGIDRPGGPRTATLYLLDRLFALRPGWRFIVYLSKREPLYEPYPHVQQVTLPVRKGAAARLLAQVVLPFTAYTRRARLVHFTKSQGGLIPGIPKVLTLFDATTLRLPEMHSRSAVLFWRFGQPLVARMAKAVTTLSHDAARDLTAYLGIPPEKIRVIYLASQIAHLPQPTEADFAALQARYNLPGRYLLVLGVLALKKNLKTLACALALLKSRGVPFPRLVMAGPRYPQSEDKSIFDIIRELGIEGEVQYIGPVETAELPALYSRAAAYLNPSVHEGFGIPCIEAMQFGAPVIASRASSLPEIVGDAGLLVDEPLSDAAWADAIARLLADPALQADLRERGLERVKLFSWEKSAADLAALYEQISGIKEAA